MFSYVTFWQSNAIPEQPSAFAAQAEKGKSDRTDHSWTIIEFAAWLSQAVHWTNSSVFRLGIMYLIKQDPALTIPMWPWVSEQPDEVGMSLDRSLSLWPPKEKQHGGDPWPAAKPGREYCLVQASATYCCHSVFAPPSGGKWNLSCKIAGIVL